jgi:quercetin dioxygenase-like cupin family protein
MTTFEIPPALHRNEDDLPFVSDTPGYSFQLAHVDLDAGLWVIRTRLEPGTTLQTHRHTGQVLGFTLEGRWRYSEYGHDYLRGSHIFEPANSVHTLEAPADNTERADVWFAVWGANLLLDSEGEITAVRDAAAVLSSYLSLCEEAALPRPNVMGA